MVTNPVYEALRPFREREGDDPWFVGAPARWWDTPTWRCSNDHVSKCYLRSETRGALCLAGGCRQPVTLTFPEDQDGPLPILEDQND